MFSKSSFNIFLKSWLSDTDICFMFNLSLFNISLTFFKYSVFSSSFQESCAAGRELEDLSDHKPKHSFVFSRCKIRPQRVSALSPGP